MNSLLRKTVIAAATGALTVSVAWAGAGLAPVGTPDADEEAAPPLDHGDAPADALAEAPSGMPTPTETASSSASATSGQPGALPDGQVLAGAAKVDIAPRPDDYDGTWETDEQACETVSESVFDELAENPEHGAHLAHAGSPWPENPDCIYRGGYGIGPMNAISEYDEDLGLWVRSVALTDPDGDALVLTIIDGEGYFWDYASKCDDCGIKQVSQQLADELDMDPSSFIIASTHSHTAPDFIGGWGFVPDWYMQQTADAIRDSVRQAVASARPAVLEVGEERAREFNRERRDTYRSAEEQQVAWFRAVAVGDDGRATPDDDVIATVGAYAGHPTKMDTDEFDAIAHADWPGFFERRLEDRFGGIGFHFMTGLGNMSYSGDPVGAADLADRLPAVGNARLLDDTDIRTARTTWRQPVTNVPLGALGIPGFFDRRFDPQPASLQTGPEPETAPCTSSSPYSVEVAANGALIGDDLAVSAAPGEVFANLTNTIKEKSPATVTMPLGQANDALGYMPQSFELNEAGQQGLGFVVGGVLVVNYEDSYAIDRCFGDKTLEETIGLLRGLTDG